MSDNNGKGSPQPYKVTVELKVDSHGDASLSVDAGDLGHFNQLSSVNVVGGISGFQLRDMSHIPVAIKKVAKMMVDEATDSEPQSTQPNFKPNKNQYL